jgi:hypothetical protein
MLEALLAQLFVLEKKLFWGSVAEDIGQPRPQWKDCEKCELARKSGLGSQ